MKGLPDAARGPRAAFANSLSAKKNAHGMRVAYNEWTKAAVGNAEDRMTPSMRDLACATILAAAFGAQAQPPSGAPAPPPGMNTPPPSMNPQRKAGPDPHPLAVPPTAPGAVPGDPKGSADAAYRTAQKACDARTGADKDACLKDARSAYDRALGRKDSAPAAAPTTAGGTPAAPGTGAPADTKQK